MKQGERGRKVSTECSIELVLMLATSAQVCWGPSEMGKDHWFTGALLSPRARAAEDPWWAGKVTIPGTVVAWFEDACERHPHAWHHEHTYICTHTLGPWPGCQV